MLEHFNKTYKIDLAKQYDISIPLRNGDQNPNCYWAEDVRFKTIRSGDFVGSVAEGGSVNYQQVTLTPHGNGTHTECYGHITSDESATISSLLKQSHFLCQLISITPEQNGEDQVITLEAIKSKWVDHKAEALAIRTFPNSKDKLLKKYSGTNPPYFDYNALQFLKEKGVVHLIVDLPSVDKEIDEGKLLAHKAFWGIPNDTRKTATITELAYIDNTIKDGLFLLNLQSVNIVSDASPSRPVLFEIISF